MPLDPQAKAFLSQLAPMQESAWDMTPEQFRVSFEVLAGMAAYPERMSSTEDRAVAGSGIPVRVYRPDTPETEAPETEASLPVVVYFHGGGWVVGSVTTHDAFCQQLSTRVPAVVVSVGYRLAPEHRFPAAVEDAVAATSWVSDHAGDLGADPRRLAVAGDSAGANLAAVVARKARDGSGTSIAYQLLLYPPTDMTMSCASHRENAVGYLLTAEMVAWFREQYLSGGANLRDPDASPLFAADLAGLPPALVVTAEFDPLRDEGEAYAARLREAGVKATLRRYDGAIHGFMLLDGIFDAARAAQDETVAALRRALSSDELAA